VAEGLSIREKSTFIKAGLDLFEEAVKRFIGIGLNRTAAIIKAGELVDIQINPEDIVHKGDGRKPKKNGKNKKR